MRGAVWVVAVIVIAALAAGCGGKKAEQPKAPEAAGTPAGAPAEAPMEMGEVVIVGKDNLFEPANVTITAGREYEFNLKNEGTTVHNLIIQAKDQAGQDFASDIVVNAMQESKFKVKIDKEGTYKMVCTYHPEMVGELKVTK
jgi:plastocyanin